MTLEAANIQWPQGAVYQTGDRGTEALGVKDTVLPVPDNVVAAENFETNPITGSGTWILDTTLPHTGLRYLRSAVITDNQSTNYTFPVPALATSVRFWHRVSSEAGFDFFKIYKNSISVPNQLFQLSGLLNTWQLFTVSLTGITSIIVEYSKDSSASAGLDAAFIDDIEWFIPGTPAIQNFEPYHLDTNNRVKVTLLGETIAVTGSLSIGNEIEIKNDLGNPVPVIFAVPQHTIVDSGTVVATQGTTPWVTDDLTFASDKVDVSGSVITVTIEPLTFAEDKVDVSGSVVSIEALTFAEDKIDVSGSSIVFTTPQHVIVDSIPEIEIKNDSGSPVPVSGTITVNGTVTVNQGTNPWNIDDLTFSSDKVDVSGSSITIEALTFAEDKVDVSGSSIIFTSPQHVIIDSLPEVEIKNDSGNPVPISGTVTANQGTSPWVIDDLTFASDKVDVSGSAVTIESLTFAEDKIDVSGSSVAVTQGTSPWVVDTTDRTSRQLGLVDIRKATTVTVPAQTSTSSSAATVLSSNGSRRSFILQNTGTVAVKISLGGTNPTQTAYHFCLAPAGIADDGTGATYLDDQWTGDVRAISVSAGTIVVTEIT